MHKKILWLALGLSLAVVCTSLISRENPLPSPVRHEPAATGTLPPAFGALPAHFEPGLDEGEFVARRAGLAMTLDHEGARVHLTRHSSAATLGLMLEGAAPRAARPENRLPGVSNYFLGEDPRAWRTGVPHYARIRYEQIYPGIDLVYYGSEGTLEYDFLVAPGADPSRIRMSYRDAKSLRIENNGDLHIDLGSGTLVHRKPVSFQMLPDGERRAVPSRFELRDGIVTFALGDWDRKLPLVIDPVLSFATYFGGSNDNEEIHAIHVDAAGDIYVAGHTNSPNLPVTGGAYQPAQSGLFDVFVSKFNSTGTVLLYSTYLGGTGIDMLHLMRVDATGNAYLAGQTSSANFPVSAGAPQSTFGGINDIFVAKLDAAGAALLYSTYLGGSGGEPASAMFGGLEVDAAGNAWIYSDTDSVDFPASAGAPQPTRGNPNGAQFDQDVTLTRINAAGTAFALSTYHGGSGIESVGDFIDEGRLLGLDANGNVWIAGTTASADMPVTAGAFDTTHNGPVNGGDFFITRFDAASGARTMSTYLGGTGDDLAETFAVNVDGDVFIAGRATSGFPVTAGAADTTYNGGSSDIGIAKFGADVSVLAYASYLGGNSGESAHGLRLDSSGTAFVAGSTQSANFPATAGAADTTFNGGGNDGFIARLNAAGSAFLYATLAGSSDSDGVTLFEIDAAGGAYALLGDAQGDAFVSAGGLAHAGNFDDYFVKLNAAGSAFLDASYLGGSGDDFSLAMHVDAQQNLYLGGVTSSADFPATAGTVQPTKPGAGANEDMYLVKFATTPDGPVAQPGTLALTAATFSFAESVGSATIAVSRSGGSSGAVSVTCAAAAQGGDTATAGTDFTAASVTLNWADGDSANKTCGVTLTNDTTDESDETFTVTLSNAQGGAALGAPSTATVTILDDDAPPAPQAGTVQFDPATYSANENGGSVTITLTRTLGADGAISVNVASGGGSASAGSDYTALSQTVSWADGDSAAKTVALVVMDDSADEQNETVTLTLSAATGGASLGTGTATVTIVDDDVTPPPPGPVSQPSRVQGKYGGGGGLDGLLILGLALVLAVVRIERVRRSGFAMPVLFATLASLSVHARAEDGWYVGLRAGVVETTQTASSIQRALVAEGHDVQVTMEDREPALTALGGFRWQNGLAIELGFSHLGEFDVTVGGNTNDPAGLLSDTHALLAQAGQAVSAGLAWNLRMGDRVELTPRAGVSYWQSTREVESEAGRLRSRDDGVDIVAGITLSLKLDAAWAVGLGFEAWPFEDRNDLRVWQLSLVRGIE
jgi:hypothetical protein